MRLGFVTLVFVALLVSCSKKKERRYEEDHAKLFGFIETTSGRGLAEQAIDIANRVTASDQPVIYGSWQKPPDKNTSVPVYWVVTSGPLSDSDILLVPDNERCILANRNGFRKFIEFLKSAPLSSFGDDLPQENILAMMLLHELGHIVNNHGGSYSEDEPWTIQDVERLNVDDNESKSNELEADQYVADSVRTTMHDATNAGSMDAMSMSLMIIKLAFQLRQAQGSYLHWINARSVRWDNGYSHPNLMLRLLTLQYLITPNETTREQLDSFLLGRKYPGHNTEEVWGSAKEENEGRSEGGTGHFYIRNRADEELRVYFCSKGGDHSDWLSYQLVLGVATGETSPVMPNSDLRISFTYSTEKLNSETSLGIIRVIDLVEGDRIDVSKNGFEINNAE